MRVGKAFKRASDYRVRLASRKPAEKLCSIQRESCKAEGTRLPSLTCAFSHTCSGLRGWLSQSTVIYTNRKLELIRDNANWQFVWEWIRRHFSFSSFFWGGGSFTSNKWWREIWNYRISFYRWCFLRVMFQYVETNESQWTCVVSFTEIIKSL